jgi:hypothetical protein
MDQDSASVQRMALPTKVYRSPLHTDFYLIFELKHPDHVKKKICPVTIKHIHYHMSKCIMKLINLNAICSSKGTPYSSYIQFLTNPWEEVIGK